MPVGPAPQSYEARPQPGQPYYAPGSTYGVRPGDPMPGAARPRPRISRGLMIGGVVTLGVSYLLGLLPAAIMLDIDNSRCRDCQRVGGFLFIPVVGPFLAIEPARHAQGLLGIYGVVQAAGAVMMIAGIIKYKNSKRAAMEAGYAHWKLPHERTLTLDVAASQHQLGPKLSLRF